MRKLPALFIAFAVAGCAGTSTVPGGPGADLPQMTRASAAVAGPPVIGGCSVFPANNPWNTDISDVKAYPADVNSAKYISNMSPSTTLHPDFGQNPTYGIPFAVVPSTQPKVPVSFRYNSQSNKGPYPIPPNAPIEGGKGASSGSDRHVLILQSGTCKLYEMWQAEPVQGGKSWQAGSGALFNLNSNALRPNGWTSADAAGLPILPPLVKCDEVAAGSIDHALRVTFDNVQAGFVHPATHYAGNGGSNFPPFGARLRLKASYKLQNANRTASIIITAMKKYGLFIADIGSNWYFQGEGTGNNKKTCWNDNDLDVLKAVPGSAFEVLKVGKILHTSGP
jgi:hypothetical protein